MRRPFNNERHFDSAIGHLESADMAVL